MYLTFLPMPLLVKMISRINKTNQKLIKILIKINNLAKINMKIKIKMTKDLVLRNLGQIKRKFLTIWQKRKKRRS